MRIRIIEVSGNGRPKAKPSAAAETRYSAVHVIASYRSKVLTKVALDSGFEYQR